MAWFEKSGKEVASHTAEGDIFATDKILIFIVQTLQ